MEPNREQGGRFAAWTCSCSRGQTFYCSACVLTHINPSEGKQHSVKPLETSEGRHRCALCKKQAHSSDATTVKAHNSFVSSRLSLGSDTPAEGGAEPDSRDLRSQLYELRADVVAHMTQALAGLAAFEETKLKGESGEPADTTRGNNLPLQQITDMPRPDAGRMEAGSDGLLEALRRRELECAQMVKELRELSAQNRLLVSEVSRLNQQLRLSGTKAGQPIPGMGITAEDVANVTAKKVSEMMPILSDIRVSSPWMSSHSMESFLQLAEISAQDQERAPSVRKVAKVCILVAQIVGPCKAVYGLGNVMRVRLENDTEGCLLLARHLKQIYLGTLGDAASQDLLREILSRMQSGLPTFDSGVALIAHLSKVVPALQLSSFCSAFFNFLEEPDETTSKWLSELAALPTQWNQSVRAVALSCIQSLLNAVGEQKFHKSCLQLTEMLVHQKPADPEPMLTFIMKAADAIRAGNMTVTSLIHKLYGYIYTSPEQAEEAFRAMKLFPGKDTTKEKVTLLMCQLESLSSSRHANLNWLYSDWNSAGEALKLQEQLTLSEGLEESAHVGESLFTALSASLTASEAQTCIKLMRQLYEAKEGKREGLMFSLISLVKTNLAPLFLKELAALPEERATPAQVEETNKLLNLVRKYPSEDILIAARHLANMICLLRNESVQEVVLTHELKIVLKQRTESLKKLLTALKPMVKSDAASYPLAVKLLSLIPKVPDELVYLMLFVPEVQINLASAPMVSGQQALSFCMNVIVKCFEVKNLWLLKILRNQLQDNKLSLLAELLRKSQKEHLTILDVCELNLLPNVKADCIQVFDCMRNEAEAVLTRQSVKVDTSSSFVFIDNGNIFVCGGYEIRNSSLKKNAYILMCDGQVDTLPLMRELRGYHGIIHVNGIVHVFGGSYPPGYKLKSGESMPLAERLWREVPDMREERYCFNPCYYRSLIFLCGYGSNLIDCFDPETNSFPQPQPSVTVPESHFCCTFEQESNLVVLAYNYLSKFNLENGSLVKLSDKRERVCHTVWPNSPPRFLNNTVYFVENSTWCWVNMKDGLRNEVKA